MIFIVLKIRVIEYVPWINLVTQVNWMKLSKYLVRTQLLRTLSTFIVVIWAKFFQMLSFTPGLFPWQSTLNTLINSFFKNYMSKHMSFKFFSIFDLKYWTTKCTGQMLRVLGYHMISEIGDIVKADGAFVFFTDFCRFDWF